MYPGIDFPKIDPVLFQWGWFAVRWYSLAYIFGILGAWTLARKMSAHSDSTFTPLKIDDFLIWATVGIVAGGRLGYVLFYNLRYFCEYPLKTLAVWEGGMSFHGGLLGVIAATVLFAKKRHINILAIGDILACVAPIGLFLGRLANFVNGELYGRVSHSVPWVMFFPNAGTDPRHPSQLYEAIGEGLLLFLVLNTLWWFFPKYRRRTGFLSGLFLLLYGTIRFILEFFREPDFHLGFIFEQITMGQILCIPMALFGLLLINYASPKSILKRIEKKR